MLESSWEQGARGKQLLPSPAPEAPEEPEATEEERGVGETDVEGDEPEEAEPPRQPVKRKRKPIRLGGAGKRWTIYADVAIANDDERIPTFGENSLLTRLQDSKSKSAAQTIQAIMSAQTRLPNAPVSESFQLTADDLRRIISEEIAKTSPKKAVALTVEQLRHIIVTEAAKLGESEILSEQLAESLESIVDSGDVVSRKRRSRRRTSNPGVGAPKPG